MADLRERIVAEARSWLGTPYRHLGNVKGGGVDCAMLLCEVYKAVGITPPDFDPRPYPIQWYLHREEEKFLNHLLPFGRRTPTPVPGDVVMFRFGRAVSHGAILLAPDLIIHAYKPDRKVVICELRSLVNRFDSYWTVL